MGGPMGGCLGVEGITENAGGCGGRRLCVEGRGGACAPTCRYISSASLNFPCRNLWLPLTRSCAPDWMMGSI
jgi:hypothetical protein